jgi:hypothetical protein
MTVIACASFVCPVSRQRVLTNRDRLEAVIDTGRRDRARAHSQQWFVELPPAIAD